jgi:hypothetical protein
MRSVLLRLSTRAPQSEGLRLLAHGRGEAPAHAGLRGRRPASAAAARSAPGEQRVRVAAPASSGFRTSRGCARPPRVQDWWGCAHWLRVLD